MQMPRFRFIDTVVLLLLVALAAGARAWYLHDLAADATQAGPLMVQEPPRTLPAATEAGDAKPVNELEALANSLKTDGEFAGPAPLGTKSEPTAHAAPGYPWLLAALEWSPIQFDTPDRTMRWLQCVLGTLTVALYFLFAWRAFASEVVALLTGLLCALHPFWIISTAEINDGVLATFMLALCVFLGTRGSQSGGALTSLLFGLALAGLALVRAALLPFAFVALLWYLLRCRSVKSGWLCALLAVLGLAIGLVPWTQRNYRAFQDLVPVVTSTHYHLWVGNNPKATGGPMSDQALTEALAEARGEAAEAVKKELDQLGQSERYRELGRAWWNEVRANPPDTLKRRLWAGLYFFFGEEFFRDGKVWRGDLNASEEGPEAPEWLAGSYRSILYGSLLGMLLLGVLGWRWTHSYRVEAMPSSLAVMWVALPYLLGHAGALSGPRLPLDGILLCYAAFAVGCLFPPLGGHLIAAAEREAPEGN